jgi:hypothetical protein
MEGPVSSKKQFSRENEGVSSPKQLADEAIELFRKARRLSGDPPEKITEDEEAASRASKKNRLPSYPKLCPV